MNLTMVTTGLDLDPDNIIAWIVEPSEQGPVDKAIEPNLINNKQEEFYIGPFRILTARRFGSATVTRKC